MRSSISKAMIAVVLSLGVVGCVQAPAEELEEAQIAFERARARQADRYAAEAWARAEAAFESARLEIEAQEQQSVLRRSYDEARRLLAEAKAAAKSAEDAAVAGRGQARLDAEQALARAEESLNEAEATVGNVAGRRVDVDIEAIKSDIREAWGALEAANADLEAGDYPSARARADTIRALAIDIVTELTEGRMPAT